MPRQSPGLGGSSCGCPAVWRHVGAALGCSREFAGRMGDSWWLRRRFGAAYCGTGVALPAAHAVHAGLPRGVPAVARVLSLRQTLGFGGGTGSCGRIAGRPIVLECRGANGRRSARHCVGAYSGQLGHNHTHAAPIARTRGRWLLPFGHWRHVGAALGRLGRIAGRMVNSGGLRRRIGQHNGELGCSAGSSGGSCGRPRGVPAVARILSVWQTWGFAGLRGEPAY